MSSNAVGDRLEMKIFNFFKSEIAGGRFFAKPECCKIYRKKGYYSKDRGKNIKFDISIEVYLPGSKSYSLLILIECKNYNHPVPVDDAEEFFAKVQQVSGANVKGIIASTSALQEGTLSFCNSKRFGVLRYFGSSDFKWVLYRSPSSIQSWSELNDNSVEIQRGLAAQQHVSRYFDFYCCYDDRYTYSLKAFLLELTTAGVNRSFMSQIRNSSLERQSIVEFIAKDEIETLAGAILKQVKYNNGPVPLDKICQLQFEEAGLIVKTGVQPTARDIKVGALGRICFNPLEITIYDKPDSREARHRFTLAHELGHHFLGHSKYMNGEYCDIADLRLDSSSTFEMDDLRRMDWQANYFGSCLLLPRETLKEAVLQLANEREVRNRGFGLLYVDNQECNQAIYKGITSHLKLRYKVSALALKLRLEALGLLRDVRTTDQSFTASRPGRFLTLNNFHRDTARIT